MRAALSALDTTVGKDAQLGIEFSGATLQVFGCAAHGQDGFAQLADRGVGLLRRHSHLVGEGAQLVHLQAKSRHGIGGQVRCIGQVKAARLRQGQHLRQRSARLVRVISGQGQVVQCLGGFRRRVACRASHFLGSAVEQGDLPVSLFGGTGNKAHGRLYSFEAIVKGRKCGDTSGAQRHNGRGQLRGKLLPDLRYLFAYVFQLRADVFQLCAQLVESVLGQLQLLGDELQRLLCL